MAARFWVGGTGTWDASNTTNWAATTGGAGGQSVPGAADTVTFDASSGTSFTVTLGAGYNPTITTFTGGAATVTLDLNNQTLTCTTFSFTGTAVRTLAFGTGNITLTGNATTIWTTATTTGLTITGTPVVNANYSGATGTRTIGFGTIVEAQAPSVNITAGTDAVQVTGSVNNVNTTGFSGQFNGGLRTIYGNLTIAPTTTLQSSSSATTLSATSGTKTIASGNLLLPFPMSFQGGNTTVWQMQNNFIQGNATTHTLTLGVGQLDFNNYSANIFVLSSTGTTLRGVGNIGGNTMNITGVGATVLNLGAVTNFTMPQGYIINLVGNGTAGTARTTSFGAFLENANPYAPNILVSAGADNVTVGTGTIRDLDFTGFSGNLLASTRILLGNLTVSPTMTVVASSGVTTTFTATSGTKTITTNGTLFPTVITINAANATIQLADNLNMTNGVTATSLTVTGGTLDLNDKTATANAVTTSGTALRSIAFGTSGVINIAGNGATVWTGTNATNFSYTGNAVVNLTYNGATGTRTIVHGTTGGSDATKAPPMYFATGATDTIAATASSHWSDLIFANGANVVLTNTIKNIYGNLTFSPGISLTAGSSGIVFAGNIVQTFDSANVIVEFPLTIGTGTSNGNLRLANTTTGGNTRLTTLTSGTLDLNGQTLTVGYFGSSNTNTRAIYQNGGTFNVYGFNTSVWSMNTSTGFSYPTRPTVNFTYAGAVGSRSLTGVIAGGTYNNSIDFNFVSGSDTLGVGTCNANDLNFTGFTGTLLNTARSLYGNLTLGTGMTATAGASATTFNGTTGEQTLVTNGVATDFPITIASTGGNFVLGESLSIGATRVLTVNSGNLLANGFNITTGQFSSTNANPRVIDISNVTVTLLGINTVWNMTSPSNATFTATNSNINLSNTSTTSRAFAGGSLTYGNLDIGGATGTSVLFFTGNNTFAGALTSSKTVAHTIQFADTSTTTVGGFTVSGSSGAVVTISSTSLTPHNLVLTGGGNVSTVDYLNISYSNASPDTDTWYAGDHSTNSGNNLGWIFPTLSGSSNFFLVF